MSGLTLAAALTPLIASVVAATVIGGLLRSRAANLVLDRPNQRSLHATPTPRIGGVGIMAGIIISTAFADFDINVRLLAALVLLIAISALDDLYSLGAGWRMLAHLAGAGLAASILVLDFAGFWPALAATFVIAWMTNLYNFMDGSDGLAGGMAAFGFGTYGIAALCADDPAFALFNFSVAAAALGFLVYNFPPARVFMGDAGAIPLGFLAAVCAIAGWRREDWPLWFGVVVFSPFIVDATLTLARRLARGARVWQAHREHYYQRLVQCGWGHRKTLLAEYALMSVVCALALGGVRASEALQAAVVAAVVALYVMLIVVLERRLGPVAVQNA